MINGVHNAFQIFKDSASHSKAYRSFLARHGVRPGSIKKAEDFARIPVTDKKNYIHRYSLFDRLAGSGNSIGPVLHASSGSSGTPTYWFADDERERRSGDAHEIIFHKIFGIGKQEPTLVIVCFAMGLWIAGPHSAASSREVARRGYRITVATPGYALTDILGVLDRVAPLYRHVILFGHPARLMDIAHETMKRGLKESWHRFHLIYSGDKVSEQWRDDIADLLKIPDPGRSILGMYGSTDAAAMGHETPLSVYVRRRALVNKKLRQRLFGNDQPLPALYQYHPECGYFFEGVNGELVLTADTVTPLVRYNIHDRGSVISYEEMKKILKGFGFTSEVRRRGFDRWKLPFVTVSGRTDVATRFYAVAIYPEHISAAFHGGTAARELTGNFFAYVTHSKGSRKQKFHIDCELKREARGSRRLKTIVQRAVVRSLTRLSLEYRKIQEVLGEDANPFVHLVPFGRSQFYPKQTSGVLQLAGGKPRVIKVS